MIKSTHWLTRILSCLMLLALGGCVITGQDMARRYGVAADNPSRLMVCHDYGCDKRSMVALDSAEWRSITSLFLPAAANAEHERRRVARAIGLMEQLIGPKTGTAEDSVRSAAFTFDARGQMDCLDESSNTTRYLSLFEHAGLMRFHRTGDIAYRGYLLDGQGPHNTATLVEHATGRVFAVDSWFHANGHDAEIVPLQQWKRGWSPPVYHKTPRHTSGEPAS